MLASSSTHKGIELTPHKQETNLSGWPVQGGSLTNTVVGHTILSPSLTRRFFVLDGFASSMEHASWQASVDLAFLSLTIWFKNVPLKGECFTFPQIQAPPRAVPSELPGQPLEFDESLPLTLLYLRMPWMFADQVVLDDNL